MDNHNTTEEWRDIPGYEGIYAVSNLGRVKRLAGSKLGRGYILKEDRLLKPGADTNGYLAVKLGLRGVFRIILVHRLVMLAFVGPEPNMDVNHINMIRDDNRLENLEYLTHAENMAHSTNSTQTKLTEKDIPEIRQYAELGFSEEDIAKLYRVSRKIIVAIVYRFTWRHVK